MKDESTMRDYLQSFLLVSVFFILYALNYSLIRSYETGLYFAGFFDFRPNAFLLFMAYLASAPPIAFVLYKSRSSFYALFMSYLLIIGVLPGTILYAMSGQSSIFHFFIFYVFLAAFFALFTRPGLSWLDPRAEKTPAPQPASPEVLVHIRMIQLFAFSGLLIFIYLFFKYFGILNLKSIQDVYSQRALFAGMVLPLEVYLITYAKFIATFSFLILAIYQKNIFYLLPAAFIFLVDYLLAAHKSSVFLLAYILFHFHYGYRMDLLRHFFKAVLAGVFLFSCILHLTKLLGLHQTPLILIGLYDRIFHVTAGLFARYFDFAHTHYFFHGGSGILGRLFSGVPENIHLVIGSRYFSEGVAANADLIADGYINFGFFGVLGQLFFLWLAFSRQDNQVLRTHHNLLFPLTLVYGLVLFSMGLQTALLTGGMLFFLLLLKTGFHADR